MVNSVSISVPLHITSGVRSIMLAKQRQSLVMGLHSLPIRRILIQNFLGLKRSQQQVDLLLRVLTQQRSHLV